MTVTTMKGMINMPKIANLFIQVSLKEKAEAEKKEAQLSLLSAHTAREYAESVISYRNAQIARLTRFIANESQNEVS